MLLCALRRWPAESWPVEEDSVDGTNNTSWNDHPICSKVPAPVPVITAVHAPSLVSVSLLGCCVQAKIPCHTFSGMNESVTPCRNCMLLLTCLLTSTCMRRWQVLMWPRHEALAFQDRRMEIDFRLYWVHLSHPVAVLASLLLLLRHAGDARSCREICLMPSVICNLRYAHLTAPLKLLCPPAASNQLWAVALTHMSRLTNFTIKSLHLAYSTFICILRSASLACKCLHRQCFVTQLLIQVLTFQVRAMNFNAMLRSGPASAWQLPACMHTTSTYFGARGRPGSDARPSTQRQRRLSRRLWPAWLSPCWRRTPMSARRLIQPWHTPFLAGASSSCRWSDCLALIHHLESVQLSLACWW